MKFENEKKFRRDNQATGLLIQAGKRSAEEALRSSKALGLTVSYVESGWVINESPEGRKTFVKRYEINKASSIGLKKGMILHAKK